jgi:hypothetical protein
VRDNCRVSLKKSIAFSRAPVRTNPYNRISHRESTPGAAAASHSTRILPSGMPQVRIRRWLSGYYCFLKTTRSSIMASTSFDFNSPHIAGFSASIISQAGR